MHVCYCFWIGRIQESGRVDSHGTSSKSNLKQPKKVAYARSVSCHLLGNELHPGNHAGKSRSEANLAKLAIDKNAGKLSPVKQLQKPENRDSFASMRSLNSFLSVCEGMDADYLVEDDSFLNNEPDEDDKKPLVFTPNLQHRQSVASDVSVNSVLSLVEEDTAAGPVEVPLLTVKEPEDSAVEQEKENQDFIDTRQSGSTEPATEKREKRGGTGRTTSDEKSQTGRVSL